MRDEERRVIGHSSHSVVIQGRERVTISGVRDVDSFNEAEIHLLTELGMISLVGQDMHISKLNLEDGQLIVDGLIGAVEYEDEDDRRSSGLFSRMFR